MRMLFLKAVKYVLKWGILGGLLVALFVSTISFGIDKLFALQLPAFTTVSRWTFFIWLGLVVLDATKVGIHNYFASMNMARKWDMSQHDIIDAIVNHNLAQEAHLRWKKDDFLQWYNLSKMFKRIKTT